MSDAYGQVYFVRDALILHFEYNGCGDFVTDPLRGSAEEVSKYWRQYYDKRQFAPVACTCGRDEEVEIANDYGGGGWWAGRACRYCGVITKNRSTIELEANDIAEHAGLPAWWQGDRWWADLCAERRDSHQ